MSSRAVEELLKRADKDLHGCAALVAGDSADETVGQIAQGTVEKLCRAVLLSVGVRFNPRSKHDLNKFFEKLRQAGFDVPDAFVELRDLTIFAMEGRYMNMEALGLEPFDQEDLLDRLKAFRVWVADQIK